MWNFLLKILSPFIKFWGRLRLPFTRKKITGYHYYKLKNKLDIGDTLLVERYGEFSNIFNPADINHSGIYVGNILGDEVEYVAEANSDGVVLTDLVTFFTTQDILLLCKPRFVRDRKAFESSIKTSTMTYHSLPYDYIFTFSKKAFYCFELVAACYKDYDSALNFKIKEFVKGKYTYSEETFLDKALFEVIYDSRSDKC